MPVQPTYTDKERALLNFEPQRAEFAARLQQINREITQLQLQKVSLEATISQLDATITTLKQGN